ncbi:MAG: hypothetical protein GTO03_17010, partial [Planctomycetales bacterium]|nr:hypothetical protein [Planctomycetales bacterium]
MRNHIFKEAKGGNYMPMLYYLVASQAMGIPINAAINGLRRRQQEPVLRGRVEDPREVVRFFFNNLIVTGGLGLPLDLMDTMMRPFTSTTGGPGPIARLAMAPIVSTLDRMYKDTTGVGRYYTTTATGKQKGRAPWAILASGALEGAGVVGPAAQEQLRLQFPEQFGFRAQLPGGTFGPAEFAMRFQQQIPELDRRIRATEDEITRIENSKLIRGPAKTFLVGTEREPGQLRRRLSQLRGQREAILREQMGLPEKK